MDLEGTVPCEIIRRKTHDARSHLHVKVRNSTEERNINTKNRWVVSRGRVWARAKVGEGGQKAQTPSSETKQSRGRNTG